VQIDHNVWLLLLLNITLILAFSWFAYGFLKRSTHYFNKYDGNSSLTQFTSKAPLILANRYLIVRRMIKTETDDKPPYTLLSLHS
jgi:hypothetical protein